MHRGIITFGDIENKKTNFTLLKILFLEDLYLENILISDKTSCSLKSYKYFIGCMNDDYKMKPLHIMLWKTSAYVKGYDGETKWMCFGLIEDHDLLKTYNGIWRI